MEEVLFITGGASGIGAATATLAVQRGLRVVIADVQAAQAQALAAQLGENAWAVMLDVRSGEHWQRALDQAWRRWGRVDVLVNNAGIVHPGLAREVALEQHRRTLEVNFLGAFTGMLAALPRFKAQGSGHLITICSMTSFVPMPGFASYAAAKHALRAAHHSLALEERDSPVAFTIIHPPAVETPMLRHEQDFDAAAIAFSEDTLAPQAIAEAILGAVEKRPRELIYPPLLGNAMRLFGATPGLIYRELIKAETKGRVLLEQRRADTPPTD